MEVTEPLVPRPIHAVNATPAYLFRKVSDPEGTPTILFDEIDTIFGPKAKENEDLRGLLNAGHRRGAMAGRCTVRGKEIVTEELPAYAAVALAGLNDLPDTIMTRSVVVRMRRRAPGERVEPWRLRTCGPEAYELGEALAVWADVVRPEALDHWPEMPPGVEDRNADVWEALLTVADLAGGTWPERARVAAVALVTAAAAKPPTLGVLLLADVRRVFEDHDAERLPTDALVNALVGLEESPWGDLRGRELDARGLARRLAKYDVKPRNIRHGGAVVKGYDRADFLDPWSRYLSPLSPDGSATTATSATTALLPSAERSGVAAVADKSPKEGGPELTCRVCGGRMLADPDGLGTHPGCDPLAVGA